VFAGAIARVSSSAEATLLQQFLMIGVCGGLTTFSSFSLQTLDLIRDGDWLKASLNTLLSFACCLAAVWLGRVLALTVLPK